MKRVGAAWCVRVGVSDLWMNWDLTGPALWTALCVVSDTPASFAGWPQVVHSRFHSAGV